MKTATAQKEKFVENFKNLRNVYSLSRKKTGNLVGVSENSIWRWEKGLSIPTDTHMKKISKIFGMKLKSLLGDISIEKNPEVEKALSERRMTKKKEAGAKSIAPAKKNRTAESEKARTISEITNLIIDYQSLKEQDREYVRRFVDALCLKKTA